MLCETNLESLLAFGKGLNEGSGVFMVELPDRLNCRMVNGSTSDSSWICGLTVKFTVCVGMFAAQTDLYSVASAGYPAPIYILNSFLILNLSNIANCLKYNCSSSGCQFATKICNKFKAVIFTEEQSFYWFYSENAIF